MHFVKIVFVEQICMEVLSLFLSPSLSVNLL